MIALAARTPCVKEVGLANWDRMVAAVTELSRAFARQRQERQGRTRLDPADFDALRLAGFHLSGVPASEGGLWHDLSATVRPLCMALRALAAGDPSVALVAAMHPTVLIPWLLLPQAPAPFDEAWARQRRQVSATVAGGAWWGTLKSEPGSHGDLARTRASVRPRPRPYGAAEPAWLLSGEKHFGSGSGLTSYMVTTAIPEGESGPDLFFLDVRSVPWDGSQGLRLLSEWQALGMRATQSHAFGFQEFPAARAAWPGAAPHAMPVSTTLDHCVFTAVIAGVVDAALTQAREQLIARAQAPRSYDRVEGVRMENDAWLISQAFEGMLCAVEAQGPALRTTLRAKTVVADLAEAVMRRICRLLGGSTLLTALPYAAWAEDVRALGFLRPPWALAFDQLYEP